MWAFGHHTWRFAEHQYDYIGADNNNISSTNDGWIDLFGWGTSGWMSGAVCYQPWDTSKTNADYFPGGSNENDLTGGYAEADWAWHNAIQNVGSQHHLWRTLTRNEWEYLFYGRTDAALKYGGATVDTVRGVVILPDNWTLPAGLSFTPGVNGWLPYHNYDSSNSFSNNNYTLEQWALMEASGAIFLPASGGRYGSRWWNDTKSYYADDNYIIVTVGYYWSVSHELTNNIFIVSENYYPQPSDIASRCWGVSVRPVLDNTI